MQGIPGTYIFRLCLSVEGIVSIDVEEEKKKLFG